MPRARAATNLGHTARERDHAVAKAAALAKTQDHVIQLLLMAEFRDGALGQHVVRMAGLCGQIATVLGWGAEPVAEIESAARMHDVGKVVIPDSILEKSGALSQAERVVMQTHAEAGHDMLSGTGIRLIDQAADIALTHHERFDGAGYPNGLSGEAIPIEGRIAAAADAYDALTSDRVYRPAFTHDEAVDQMRAESGTHFDPRIVEALLEVLDTDVLVLPPVLGGDGDAGGLDQLDRPAPPTPAQDALKASAGKCAERELERLSDAAEYGTDAVVSIDPEDRVCHWNRGAERLYGFGAEEAIGHQLSELIGFTDAGPDADLTEQKAIAMVLGGDPARQIETRRRRKDGVVIDVLTTLVAWRRDGQVVGVTAVSVDISEHKQMELRLQHLADRDPLTGIFNRRRMIEELARQLRYAARFRRGGVVLTFDLDKFKLANDTYGHATGDVILKTVAEVLLSRMRDTDFVARMGGDEFSVILPEASEAEAITVARDLRALLGARQIVGPIAISVGIALFTGEVELTADEMLARADTALYEAKERGGDQVRVYSGQASGALNWVQRIRDSLAEDRFELYAQPILDLRTGEATHHELLIRMVSEHGKIISPAEFIPTAERFGMIHEIDEWVTANGLRLARAGQRVAINLSALSIGHEPILDAVRAAIDDGLDPANVMYEITETAALSNIPAARQFAGELTALGCSVALDDFGTGFGSFNWLKHLPATYLKIDIDFVRHLATNETDQHIVKAIIGIAHSLNKLTVAEGVEDAATLAMLREYGVDQAQGYHLGRPARI
jgi:diguanylate cyclase (GGDEF)-like protein/PAS domain S-box-containing protein